jgi:hypothetical protein
MKTAVLLTALTIGWVLSVFAQKEKRKDDVYPVPVEQKRERFIKTMQPLPDSPTGFKIINFELVWQRVFESQASSENLERYFRRSGIFKHIETGPNELSGFLSYFNAKGAEVSGILQPYTRNALFSAFAVVDVKDGRYRVTIKKMMILNYYQDQNVKFSYEDVVFKSRQYEIKPSFLNNEAKVMNEVLTRMFKQNPEENDNW